MQFAGASAAPWGAAGLDPRLAEAAARLEYLTPLERAVILDKGKSGAAKLPVEKQREAGLVPETWSLEAVPDPASNSVVERPLSKALGSALDWSGLMRLAEKHAVRFLHVCVCTNGADPFHMTLWEGVPLREVVWLVKPKANVRRVYYQSFHPENIPPFQASLPLGQVLETPPGQPPVILAYKMNGQLIPASLGGPVRMLVPGAYGSKQIKWVQRLVFTNDYKSNDSDAELNNDTESALKTRARFLHAPKEVAAGTPAAVTGMAQVGVSGLGKVQYCVWPREKPWPGNDPYRTQAAWKDAVILPPPAGLREAQWPVRYAIVHWAALLPGLEPGGYELFCRTIDGNGIAQPMPRMLPRTGVNALHRVELAVKG